ncbi:Eco57I restriction-modification methylase domain-containing protein [Dictyoglomus thermophilum]|uniref:site-specific DNA-methyltransferase (adenine-specific) n=1 Tax=Dictyoglomus thermophilum (strain ATCC 35947 / DSM 3960 / H-6-12) TaxID=309799 RepID=B5YB62_DICT6|nr:Eco57I restriction-modification methylase domain-containing protein [Dictyoglomus thermophilum]ACI20048.1 type IIS restriction endonuclease, putative [Dictyoglomus thermophilum H-6-12]
MPDQIEKYIDNLIKNFSKENLVEYLSQKNNFDTYSKRHYGYEGDIFDEIYEVAEKDLKNGNKLKIFTIKTQKEITERTSKKKQYDLAKKILRDSLTQAGIFVFHDENGNFRFSLVYSTFSGTKREYSYYKRYTYYVAKGRPYHTFKEALYKVKFETLEDIIDAFSTLPLTKEFYTEIQNWYAWASKHAWFPGGKKEENLIRLLTRIIFVWFLKERKLIPEEIFEPNFLKDIVKDFGKADYYYNTILQNLFFATLNREAKERDFAKDLGFPENKTNFGVKTLFRYDKYLLIPEREFIKIFEKVPFINGGLFECLDDDSNYIDGFTRREEKRAKLPDFLFFSEEREEDLSDFYGERRRVKVRGLINIFKDYNFTTDENTPIDVEVSLDPELLGHIFENLLASYNPETQTTARKATGSYYTPKEIVDFMVEESLIEYFKIKTKIEEEKLRDLLSYKEDINLSNEEKESILHAIDNLKVIDPAVGSGAFPMGIVHKLVHILNKIDPENKLWYELQYKKALTEIEKVLKIKDRSEREEKLKEVNENFDESINYHDYARKLYIIENSIYGVDIQPIAIQICKLRFFLSLIIDQKIDESKENYGVKPLPHLETKFVCANTLIGLEKPRQINMGDYLLEDLKTQLKDLYKKHFNIKTRGEKKRLQEKAQELRNKIKERLIDEGWNTKEAEKIANFDIFSQTATADWFDPEWMLGVEDGFDIVIGNPPYVRQENIRPIKPVLQSQGYETFVSTADLYVYFYEKSYNLLKNGGIHCFISSNKWMRAKYGEKLRDFLKEKTTILKLIDFGGYHVFGQTVDTCTVLFRKEKPKTDHILYYVASVPSEIENHEKAIEYIKQNLKPMSQKSLNSQTFVLADQKILSLKEKIEHIGKPLKAWNVNIYRGVLTGFNEAFIIDTETRNKILANCKTEEERKRTEEIIKPVLRGRDIEKWRYKWAGLWIIGTFPALNLNIDYYPALKEYLKSFGERLNQDGKPGHRKKTHNKWFETQDNIAYYPEFEKEKIVWQRVTKSPKFTIIPPSIYCEATTHFITCSNEYINFLVGIFNSLFFKFAFYKFYMGGGIEGEIKGEFIGRFPIPPITSQNQSIVNQIEKLVDQILSLAQSKDYDLNYQKQSQVKALEKEIDQLVYKLYNLTDEEIKIIESENKESEDINELF